MPAATQPATVEIPENLTREEVRELVAHLSDDQVRRLIIDQLDRLAAEQALATDTPDYLERLTLGFQLARDNLHRGFTIDGVLLALPRRVWNQVSEGGRIGGLTLLLQLVALIIAGTIAERIAKRVLENVSIAGPEADSAGKRFGLASLGIGIGLVEIAAFAASAALTVEIIARDMLQAQLLWHQVIWYAVLLKITLLVLNRVLSPGNAEARLFPIDDRGARQARAWLMAMAMVLAIPLGQITEDFGVALETALFNGILRGGLFILTLILAVIRLRAYAAKQIAGTDSDTGPIRQWLARTWWILSIIYILVIWFMSIGLRAATGESAMVPGIGSLVLFAAIPYLDMTLKWLIAKFFESKPDESTESVADAEAGADEAEAGTNETGAGNDAVSETPANLDQGYLATALHYSRVLMGLALLAIFVRLWGIDLEALTSEAVGGRVGSALFDIGITILLAWALWGVIRISIERKLEDESGGAEEQGDEAEAGGLGGTRTETILPLIRAFIKITLIVMSVLICLSALGVNIGPLIAGAGVVGLAIGFGAQTLVRDIVSGFFYLLDDAFRIGEYVVIDQIRGTVEKISIRSFQLRHHNGPVHTIPYGEIRSLTNWSRDWAIMKFELRIPYETDIEKVRKLIKRIGLEMMEDPVYGPLMLAPVKSQGVNRMDDSALIIRCKFTAIPGQQYLIRREAFTRIQREFEKQGIHFAPRRVLVEATTPQEAAKAAAGALDQELQEGAEGQAPKNDEP